MSGSDSGGGDAAAAAATEDDDTWYWMFYAQSTAKSQQAETTGVECMKPTYLDSCELNQKLPTITRCLQCMNANFMKVANYTAD